jgi:hypothetical protein
VNRAAAGLQRASLPDRVEPEQHGPPPACDLIGHEIAFVALLYVARGVAEHDAAALAIFDTLTALCRDQLADLKRRRMLRADLDLEWAALHTVLINLGTVILEPGISRQLGRPFLTKRQINRWKEATTALFVAGELQLEQR